MNRIRLVAVVLISLTSTAIYAQNTLQDKADELFAMKSYYEAIDYYKKIDRKTPTDSVKAKIAHSYMELNDTENAEYWYDQVGDLNGIDKKHHFLLAEALEVNGKYDEAKKLYEQYQQEVGGNNKMVKEKVDAINNIDRFKKDTISYSVKRLQMNSTFNAFSPAFYADGIIFASDRRWEFGIKHKYQKKDQLYFDLFYVALDKEKPDYGKIVHFDNNINSKFHEGQVTLNEYGTEMIFTRNYYLKGDNGKAEDGIAKLSLFRAHSKPDNNAHGWSHVEELPLNNINYSVGHPSATPDFKTLYFASDMPGGFGGADIYVSYYENGVWSKPKNLGEPVNTEGDDMFPFIASDGSLFYSSNGHGGLGGMDVYQANSDAEGNFVEVKNMGMPINSNKDDFGFIVNKEFTEGYFATNRKEMWGDDIYKVNIKDTRFTLDGDVYSLLEGASEDKKKNLAGTTIQIVDRTTGFVMANAYSDSSGKFSVKLRIAHNYTLKAEKTSYKSAEVDLDFMDKTNLDPEKTEVTLLEPFTKIRMNLLVKDKQTDSILSGVTVHVLERGSGDVMSLKSDAQGIVKMELSPYGKYVIKGQKIGYLSSGIRFDAGEATSETMTTEKPLYLKKIELEDKIVLQNVYFDVSKWDIRSDAALELDKVVAFIKDHPGITVELGAHTDARGSDKYNLKLSQKRAESSVKYIVSQGVAEELITAKGYGETVLTNKCASGVKCTEEEHQENRRVEIKITGVKEPSEGDQDAIEHETAGLDPNGNYSEYESLSLIKE